METLYIGHDVATAEMKVLFSEQDFVDLVSQYMGCDAALYLKGLIQLNEDEKRRHELELADAYDEGASDAWNRHDFEEFENGKEEGYQEGYDDGYADGVATKGLSKILEKARMYDALCK